MYMAQLPAVMLHCIVLIIHIIARCNMMVIIFRSGFIGWDPLKAQVPNTWPSNVICTCVWSVFASLSCHCAKGGLHPEQVVSHFSINCLNCVRSSKDFTFTSFVVLWCTIQLAIIAISLNKHSLKYNGKTEEIVRLFVTSWNREKTWKTKFGLLKRY